MELVNREEFNKHAKEAKGIREALRYPPHVREEWEDLYKTHKMVGAFESIAKICTDATHWMPLPSPPKPEEE